VLVGVVTPQHVGVAEGPLAVCEVWIARQVRLEIYIPAGGRVDGGAALDQSGFVCVHVVCEGRAP
jgi:hypothetical protein